MTVISIRTKDNPFESKDHERELSGLIWYGTYLSTSHNTKTDIRTILALLSHQAFLAASNFFI